MSDAKRCDRCGGYYDCNKVRMNRNNAIFRYITLWTHNSPMSEEYDLCDNCAKKLIDWLNNEKEFTAVEDNK